MIDAVTGGRDVTRQEAPRLYNLMENLCISRGITVPKLKVIEDNSLNAFASGMNERQYCITVTSGLLGNLDDAEIESVLGHELTHIRNGDVRLLVIAVIIAGVISFFAELVYRLLFQGGFRWSAGRSGSDRKGSGIALLIALAHRGRLLSIVIVSRCPATRISRRCGLRRARKSRRDDFDNPAHFLRSGAVASSRRHLRGPEVLKTATIRARKPAPT
jgi:Zn-dependent protease with chaperone function